jgi:hypothetical protein
MIQSISLLLQAPTHTADNYTAVDVQQLVDNIVNSSVQVAQIQQGWINYWRCDMSFSANAVSKTCNFPVETLALLKFSLSPPYMRTNEEQQKANAIARRVSVRFTSNGFQSLPPEEIKLYFPEAVPTKVIRGTQCGRVSCSEIKMIVPLY